jgi:Right handed beta helix region
VSYSSSTPANTGDNGRVENCIFEYTAGIGPQYYIGGIDAHAAKNWVVRGNVFRNIASPSASVSEFAVHFWNTSGSNVVERNTIVNCDRGIGFGLQGQGNTGGIIRNNMIFHASNGHPFADVGIALADSPGTSVYNNTVYFENDYPSAIEYRFTSTSGVLIANNLANRAIQARDGASANVSGNVLTATANRFRNPASGDLHLVGSWSGVTDAGVSVSGLLDDFDGQTRPQGTGIDVGADELQSQSVAPNPPTDLRVL